MNVLLLADTHLGRGQAPRLVDRLGESLARADVIVHAGDIVDSSVLKELSRFARCTPCAGTTMSLRTSDRCPSGSRSTSAECTVAVVHETGQAAGRARRLRTWFPNADVVVFGHSHIPWCERDVADSGHVQLHVNPGSAIQARRQPHCTVAWLTVEHGAVSAIAHLVVPPSGAASAV
jgi:putative phosphoesterase